MSDISRYLDYVDETYEVIVKHLVEKKLPPTDERIRLYFGVLVRPYYFWTQEVKLPEEKQPAEETKPATKKQIEISRRESALVFQASQIRFIQDYVGNVLECIPDGDSIRMDMKILPGNVRRILIEISSKKEKEEGF